ncbi:hypothetical protein [Streptomyces tsukubensis]|uniref:Secreted protein n=1 Tax=Streptomyces tsukubensis TaxID=83656 RepID=A0A1V4AA83_9ACTN|nr:hypothetical protein [Streptomyces tsukubensis]OON80020.1 hypothetical protein B1H18_12585 [Streptomyces tsukubensis]QFR97250.1 hypothetical protein GBW32_34550 [Streptomyces tsukubensis]
MNSVSRKATLAVGTMAAAVGLSLFGVGTASASPLLPYQGTVYGSLGQCLTKGNTLAQQGAIVTFNCEPRSGGRYAFYYTT